ncbi:MAG: DUF5658 family protein [bacterium]|jgi:hypothetical protein
MKIPGARFGWVSRQGYRLLLLLLAIFNLIDYRVTMVSVNAGFPEMNPFVAFLSRRGCFGIYKLVLVPAGLLFLWFARRNVTRRALQLLLFTFAAYAALMTYFGWALPAGLI